MAATAAADRESARFLSRRLAALGNLEIIDNPDKYNIFALKQIFLIEFNKYIFCLMQQKSFSN